ncbi:immunoglobulin superfamily member 10-like [Stylophora pistillata]|uniref:immunoglobulin superfamily member 10-like n=1 Tax=Stylophora pistillata TaxID=50429 RepID=UPI000C03EA1C|nr:immunoglobulin superfamily member 10-like [Stylophora pistillata]
MVTRGKTSKEVSRKEAAERIARAEMADDGMWKNGPSKRPAQARGGETPVGLTGKEPVTKTDDRSRPKRTIRPPKRFVPPSIQEIDNLTITEGSDMTLTCQISGDPPLEQFWIKPDGQRATTNVLTIKNITNGEAGEYRCEATNDCGTVSRTACVDVQSKLDKNFWPKCNCTSLVMDARPFLLKYIYDSKAPYEEDKPAATYSSATIRLKSGEDWSIDCPVDIGNPPAVITLYKGNHADCNKIAINSTLKVQNASSSEEGRYTCFAKNALGNTTISLLLLVGELNRF